MKFFIFLTIWILLKTQSSVQKLFLMEVAAFFLAAVNKKNQ